MITILINEEERSIDSIDPHWINQQINRRLADGMTVCVKVIIHQDGLNLVLTTPTCAKRAGGGRPPDSQEKEVIDLWNKLGLNEINFTGGNLVAFLKQLERIR